MNQEQIQQAACNEALVPTADRVKISTTNMRIDPKLTQKEETYQVILDIIKTSPCYNTFLINVDVPEIYMQQFCLIVKKVKKSSFYQFDLVDKKHSKLKRCEIMPYLRFIKIIINYFLSQHKSIPKRQSSYVNTIKGGVLGRLKFVSKGKDYQVYRLDTMLTDEIKRSAAYQTFIGLSTGLIPSNKSRGKGSKGKKATLTPKNKSSITVDGNIIPEPSVAFELGKLIRKTKAKIAKEARRVHETHKHLAKEAMRVHETHERLVTKKPTSVEEYDESNGEHANMPTGRRRPTDVIFRDTSNASKKKSLE
nr:hypothetical protein [Tanacetum cinerariifolium]